jgi:predicted N-acetyltransferase YhbS
VNIVVREEQHDDIQSIHAVTHSAFHKVGHSSHTEHFIVDPLRDFRDGSLEWFGPVPIAVLSEHQG